MENLYDLRQIQPKDRIWVGDKAFYLSRLIQHGYPVLPGAVVSDQVYCEFIETLNSTDSLISDLPHSSLNLDVDNPRQLQQVAVRLRQEITSVALPSKWVDSIQEAVAGWETPALTFSPLLVLPATQTGLKIDELLEVQICSNTSGAIASSLKQTWSQMFRARSLLFWQRAGIGIQEIKLAVLIQPLTSAVASGTLTCCPKEIEIQATWGLEMAITQGEVIPDYYYIQSKTGIVDSRKLGIKTIAYSLIDHIKRDVEPDGTPLLPQTAYCLQTDALSQAQQYTLDEKYLQQLISLTQKLSSEISPAFSLTWRLLQNNDSEASLHITQFLPCHTRQQKPRRELSTSTLPRQFYASSQQCKSAAAQPRENFYQNGASTLEKSASAWLPYLLKGLPAAKGRVVAPAYVVTYSSQKPESLPPGVILVASAIAPDWLPLLQDVVGFITEQGGLTSHGAILARELGIPSVVSAINATELLQTNELVVLDGTKGEITYRLSSKDLATKNEEFRQEQETSLSTALLPTQFRVPIATQLYVNLSQKNSLLAVKNLPVDGVGLLRSELMALSVIEGQHPTIWLQQGRKSELIERWQQQITHFADAFTPKPVFYRSWDWRSLELPTLAGITSPEVNPMLGHRGNFSYLLDPTLFDLELEALAAVQRSGYTNLKLLLPFVRTVEEFSFCRRRVEQAGLTEVAQFELWMMAEVPSVLFLLPEYVEAGVQGVSIGTNDLTQLLLGVDRDRGQLLATFDERHPVVMQAIAQIIRMAKSANIPCSICGQAPTLYPELIDSLIRWGITSISVEVDAVAPTYEAIARAEHSLILAAARRQIEG